MIQDTGPDLRVAVIGCGSIGGRHAANFSTTGRCRVAVCDADADRARHVADRSGAGLLPGMEELASWRPHGVVVAVPNHLHLSVARLAVDAGAHVFIEKPLSNSLEGVDGFLRYAEEAGKQVFVGCNMRFHPAVAALAEHLPAVGRPLHARAHYGNYLPNMRPGADYRDLYCAHRDQGGGVILDAIHEIDYLSWLFGRVGSISCEAERLSGLDMDVEDYAHMVLRHESGAVSSLQLDYLRPCKRRGCEIVGTEGMLLWESEGKAPEVCSVRLYTTARKAWETVLETDSLDMNAPFAALADHFLDAIEGRSPGGSPLLTGREAEVELAAALEALRQGEASMRAKQPAGQP
ncbi:Gfo/Idh/MocA family protein [Desulfohalovibrio reitneri]|uniref:Gfo/Idh/MocA family protein n=1 Tax=Desulfohalovibrio reitneri TaxID=1307759 RepID=UPI0004A76A89|nr:Gfo/Idh/MocA family oxidoreductase [Desulfohalovibrio reitneri]